MAYVPKKVKVIPDEERKKYYCTCCGCSYIAPEKHFGKSKSMLYKHNDGYLNVCNDCKQKFYEEQVERLHGDEKLAIERLCQVFDWHFSEPCYSYARSHANETHHIITNYSSKLGLGHIAKEGTTYTDTVILRLDKSMDGVLSKVISEEDIRENLAESVELWGGQGIFSEEDYKVLDDHYYMLKKSNPHCDSNQEIFIKSLCQLNLLQLKALKDGNNKSYIDANKEYISTFKQAGLKTIQDTDKNADDCWGIWMERISRHTPEEYYKDKSLYKDFDNIGSQFERFVLRPLKNLILKKNERDTEFKVDGD